MRKYPTRGHALSPAALKFVALFFGKDFFLLTEGSILWDLGATVLINREGPPEGLSAQLDQRLERIAIDGGGGSRGCGLI
jgi:hypothetical protein